MARRVERDAEGNISRIVEEPQPAPTTAGETAPPVFSARFPDGVLVALGDVVLLGVSLSPPAIKGEIWRPGASSPF
jgi:hypothetical protein